MQRLIGVDVLLYDSLIIEIISLIKAHLRGDKVPPNKNHVYSIAKYRRLGLLGAPFL